MILALVVITYNSTKIVAERTVVSHQQSIATEASKIVELWLNYHLALVEATAVAVRSAEIRQNPETLRVLKMAMKAGDFSDVYIGLTDGTMIDGADWPPPPGYDPRIRPWYQRAIEADRISFTTPYIDMTTGKPVIAIVTPLKNRNQLLGVLSADIVLDSLERNVMNVKIGKSGYTFVVNGQGTVLVHPDPKLLMTAKIQESDPSLGQIMEIFQTASIGSYTYSYQGTEKLLSYRRLHNTGWYLCTTVDKEEAFSLAKNTAMLFAMGMVFKLLGFLVGLTLLAVGGSAAILLISKRRFETVVQQHRAVLSIKEQNLLGEITRRKQVETRYQTLFNVATNAMLLDRELAFVECNEKAQEMFGYARESILGKSMLDFSPKNQQDGRDSKDKLAAIMNAAKTGEQQYFEWAFLRADGSEFPAEVSLKTLQLDQERITLSSIWDVSKRANAEEQLRQAQKMAAMGEMLGSIAHQWRQPLNALSTYIASLPSAFYNRLITKEFIEKLVTEADSQIQFMSRTINDFREFFRPSKSKQPFNILESVHSAIKLLEPQLRQNAITLQIANSCPENGLVVFGYPNEFVHVLVNILSNAREAIEEKQKTNGWNEEQRRIDLSVASVNRQVILAVRDRGVGIPEHLLPKVFTPYFTTKGTTSGTGIGLYMAKMIVEKEMKGTLSAENLPDGARFTIQLPQSEM